jgi:hypothetical protein
MTSPTTDRRQGLVGNTPIKAPVAVATTGAIVLSGEQTIDGVLTSSSRVLVKDQADQTTNGIYDSSSAAWTRAQDADGTYDFANGTLVLVSGGSVNANSMFRLNTASPVVGTSSLIWAVLNNLLNLASQIGASLVGFLQSGIGAVLRTVQDKLRDRFSLEDQGCVGNDATDDSVAFQAAIDAMSLRGGGTLHGTPGKTYRCTSSPIIKDNVWVDLKGAKIHLVLSGASDQGVRLRNNARIVGGTISVTSSGAPGTQAGIHAPINVGALVSNAGTVGAPSADEGVSGWQIRDMILSTDRAGKAAIQVTGGANNGLIENITIPDSATVGLGVALDWNYLGVLDSSSNAGIVAGKVAFLASTMYTTHPHNIAIRKVKIGNLSYATSHGVRWSGVYHCSAEDVEVAGCTFAGFYHTAGDPGFEFAPVAVKPFRHKLLKVNRFHVLNANNGFGLFWDAYADNVANAVAGVGYVPLLAPIQEIDLVLSQARTIGTGGNAGIRGQYCIGGRVEDCEATGHLVGGLAEISGDDIQFIRGRYYGNVQDNLKADNATTPPKNTRFLDVESYSAAATYAGINLATCTRPVVRGAKLGRATGETQTNAVRVQSATIEADVRDNYSYGVAGGGTHYAMAGNNDYGSLWLYANNRGVGGTLYSGVNIIPYGVVGHPLAVGTPRDFTAMRATLTGDLTPPASFAGIVGDRIWKIDSTAGGYMGSECSVAGSPGTWFGFAARS